jgi:hypothetical protein
MMVNCPHCGAENGERNLRCSLCGKPLPQGTMPQAAPPQARPQQPQGDPMSSQQQPGSGDAYGYTYDNKPSPGPSGGAYQPPPPGARSMSERQTYLNTKPETGGVKLGLGFSFNKRAVTSAVLILIIGVLFIVATYMPWLKLSNFGDKEYTGWDLYELGKSGIYGGSSFHIPDIFAINSGSEFDTSSGIILTGIWTLAGGILLLAMALLIPIAGRSYLCIIVMIVGLVMLVVTCFNLATVLIGKGELFWPVYVLPAAGLAAIIIGYDARRNI